MKKLLCIILFFILFSSGCGGRDDTDVSAPPESRTGDSSPSPVQETAAQKQIVIALEAEPSTLDAAQCADYNTACAISGIYDQIVGFDGTSMSIVPSLAESWGLIGEEGLQYVFYFRKGIKFHDGADFNAEAVKYNIERQIDKNHEAYITESVSEHTRAPYSMIESIEVLDEYSVMIRLIEPSAEFLSNLAMPSASMQSPASIKQHKTDITASPAGTGPYRFVSWSPGSELVLEKNPDYFKGSPKIDKIIYRPINDAGSRINELESGSVDVAFAIPQESEGLLSGKNNVTIVKGSGQWPYSGFRDVFYDSEDYIMLLDAARETEDEERKKLLYSEAQNILITDNPLIVIEPVSQFTAIGGRLKYFSLHPSGYINFLNIDAE